MVPAPSVAHQQYSRNLEFILWEFVKTRKIGEILDAPIDIILDEHHVVQPDIVFISNANLKNIHDGRFYGAPELVIEIIFPSSYYHDVFIKKELYAAFRIPEFWLIDPRNHAVQVLLFDAASLAYKPFSFAIEKGTVTSQVLAGLEVAVADIFLE